MGRHDSLITAANWDDNISPITDAEIELTFAGNTRLAPVMDSDMRFTSIAFDSAAGAFNIGGSGQFTLDGIINNSANPQAIANTIGIASGTHTYQIHQADGRRYEPWFDGWRLEAGAGVSYLIDARSQVYLDYEYAKARHYERPWSLNLGYRRAW